MRLMPYAPEQDGYGFTMAEDTRQTSIASPKSLFAPNNSENAKTLTLTWLLTGTEYADWFLFWEDHNTALLPFEIDLILDDFLLTRYIAKFVPGTWQLAQVQGTMYTVKVAINVVKYNAIS